MVGLGESEAEVTQVLKDLKNAACDIVTIGQYLRPSKGNLPVVEYVHPDIFDHYRQIGTDLGFKYIASGPFVRSSYHASDILT